MGEIVGNGGGGGGGGETIERKVMVGIDESDNSYYALTWALKNLKDSINSSSSPLVLFMAQPPPRDNITFSASLASARLFSHVSNSNTDLVNSVTENQRKLTLALLERAKEICASQGVIAETVTEVRDPCTATCEAVEKLNITLLVLGESDVGKIKRAIVWSVSDYCLKYAKCPLLVVKKPIAS